MEKINLEQFKKLEDQHLITDEERIQKWGSIDTFYIYKPVVLVKFNKPKPIKVKHGTQNFIQSVQFAEKDYFMVYPDEDRIWRYVVQLHVRGRSSHLDMRFEIDDETLVGWSLLVEIPGTIKEPITTLEQAREWVDKDLMKISFKTGEIKERKIRSGIIRKASIRAVKKLPEPHVWLFQEDRSKINLFHLIDDGLEYFEDDDISMIEKFKEIKYPFKPAEYRMIYDFVEGIAEIGTPGSTKNYPGVFLIVDKGRVEYGAQRPFFHEYFLSGGKLKKGRWLFRALTQREYKEFKEKDILPPGEVPEEHEIREGFYWILIQAENQTPYVLSDDAIEKGWLPPYGVSCLPEEIRKNVPEKLKYWEEKDRKKALEMRKELANYEELNVKVHSETDEFKLWRIWWKRHTKEGKPVIVIRWGPSTEFYIMKLGDKYFECEANPLESETFGIQRKYKTNLNKIKEQMLPTDSELNPTKATWCKIQLVESGKCKIFEDSPEFIKFKYKEKVYTMMKEENTDFWEISESRLPLI